ncbi:MAG: hypothetical protein FJ077_12515 [Cyanobacteria bacterium K_DeepCast_35m_m2_023]|nr:hypothetical protein [Cyanobacteria bacterium K_DeepCast_35m_m2_023]
MNDPVFDGVYGPFSIDANDRREVLAYRLALLLAAIAQLGLLAQSRLVGTALLWPWFVLLALGVGLALRWIHIYLRPLHQMLQLFWLLGSLGGLSLAVIAGPQHMAEALGEQRLWLLAIGPLFAALAGIGFKEFFCFRRPEAIGVTLLLPVALLGYLVGLVDVGVSTSLLTLESALLLVLCLRKFPMPAVADVGDKSVFAHLEAQRLAAVTPQRGPAV